MKRFTALVLTALIFLSLCACGKSEAVLAVEDKISALGEITRNSESAIKKAEAAYKALDANEKKQVKNYSELVDARETLDSLPIQLTSENFEDYFIVSVVGSNFSWIRADKLTAGYYGSAKEDVTVTIDKRSDFSLSDVTVSFTLNSSSFDDPDEVWESKYGTISVASDGDASKVYSVTASKFVRSSWTAFTDSTWSDKARTDPVRYIVDITDVTGTITFD